MYPQIPDTVHWEQRLHRRQAPVHTREILGYLMAKVLELAVRRVQSHLLFNISMHS